MSYLIKTPMELERLNAGTLNKQFKGGSSGGGERPATAEEKRLWAAQASSLEGLNQIAMPNLETGMNNLGVLANEAMNGTLSRRLREQALRDVNVSLGTSANDVLRNFGSYGTNFNPNRAADTAMQWGLGAAKQRAGAANMATMGAEDLKWNRNAALTGLASGQGAQAISGMGSLAGQITADRNNANNMAMQQQSSNMQGLVGLGSIGAYMMKKDGGEVRLGDGGGNLRPYKPVSIKLSPWSFQDSGTPAQPDSGMMQTVAGVATPIMGTKMAADGIAKIGIGAPKKAIDAAGNALLEAGKGVVDDLAFAGKDAIASVTGSTLPSAAASNGVQAIGELGTLAGDSLAATAGSELAGSTMSGALGAAAPWLVGGYALGSMLDLWADGGTVPKKGLRKDMTHGGDVDGPGTATSDSIPARLSDGEYVLNTEAVKMIGKQKLDALNNAGLRKRYGKDAPKSESYVQGAGEQKFGMGGLAALGHISRGFVPTAMQMDQQQEEKLRREQEFNERNRQFNEQMGLSREQFGLQQETHKAQMEAIAKANKKEADRAATHKLWGSRIAAAQNGDFSWAPDFVKQYNTNQGAFNNNRIATFNMAPDGLGEIGYYDAKTAQHLGNERLSKAQLLQMAKDAYMSELAGIDAPTYAQQMDIGLKQRDLAIKAPVYEQQARYYGSRADQPETVANGSWVRQPDGSYRQLYNPSAGSGGGASKTKQPLGMTKDGQFIVPDGRGGFITQPVMIDGKPASPDQINMFKKMYGLTPSQQMVKVKVSGENGEAEVQMPYIQAVREGHLPPPRAFTAAQEEAKKAGVVAELDPDGNIAFSKNGVDWYDSIEEARAVAQAAPPSGATRGVFTDQNGEVQLLEPFSRLNGLRRRMQQEVNQ